VADEAPHEGEGVPEGAAVFPEIPADLGVHPLLLAVLHAVVFLQGSDPEVVAPTAAEEALEYMAGYLQRLTGRDLARTREDIAALVGYARHSKWTKGDVAFLKSFLDEFGVGGDGQS
jgi:hypothetical protein